MDKTKTEVEQSNSQVEQSHCSGVLRKAIEDILSGYRCYNMQADDGGLPLVDALSSGPTIANGEDEIKRLADDLAAELMEDVFTSSELASQFSDEVANRVDQWREMRATEIYHDVGDHLIDILSDHLGH